MRQHPARGRLPLPIFGLSDADGNRFQDLNQLRAAPLKHSAKSGSQIWITADWHSAPHCQNTYECANSDTRRTTWTEFRNRVVLVTEAMRCQDFSLECHIVRVLAMVTTAFTSVIMSVSYWRNKERKGVWGKSKKCWLTASWVIFQDNLVTNFLSNTWIKITFCLTIVGLLIFLEKQSLQSQVISS